MQVNLSFSYIKPYYNSVTYSENTNNETLANALLLLKSLRHHAPTLKIFIC